MDEKLTWDTRAVSEHSSNSVFAMIEEPNTRVDIFPRSVLPQEVAYQDKCIAITQRKQLMLDERIYSREEIVTIDEKFFILYDEDHTPRNNILFSKEFSDPAKSTRTHYLRTDYFQAAGWQFPRSNREWPDPLIMSSIEFYLKNQGELISVNESILSENKKGLIVIIRFPNERKTEAMKYSLDEIRTELELCIDPPKRKEQLLNRVKNAQLLPDKQEISITLDPSMGFSVVAWELRYGPNELIKKCINSNFLRIAETDLWLPRDINIDHYSYDTIPGKYFKNPIFSEKYHNVHIERNPLPKSMFQLHPSKPGTQVMDYTMPESQYTKNGYIAYTVPASLDDLDQVIAFAIGKDIRSIQRGNTIKTILILLGVALIVISIFQILFKKFKKNSDD